MKKARFMLVAIATFGIVGGAVAFKANYGSTIYTGPSLNAACSVAVPNATITASGGALTFAAATKNAPCQHTLTITRS
jgi:hypothetical protein